MKTKIKYAVLKDWENTVIVLEDGRVATIHESKDKNDKPCVLINYYKNKIVKPAKKTNHEIWKKIEDGPCYTRQWDNKKSIDKEAILDTVILLYSAKAFTTEIVDVDNTEFIQDTTLNEFDDVHKFVK